MKIVVLGVDTMLGLDVEKALRAAEHEVYGIFQSSYDASDFQSLQHNVPTVNWVVNCTQYSSVDAAENNRSEAFAINSEGSRNVARLCKKKRMRLIHFSSSYVFDGRKDVGYSEWNEPNPVNVYGASMQAGERAVRAVGGDALIVRLPALFGAGGNNFVKAALKRIEAGQGVLRVVDNHVTSPTYTGHAADAVRRLLEKGECGIAHVSARGACSWYQFALKLVELVGAEMEIEPIPASANPRPSTRPPHLVLDDNLYRMWTGHHMPSWQTGLEAYLMEAGVITAASL